MIHYKEFSKRGDEVLVEYVDFYHKKFPYIFRDFYPSLRNGVVLHAVRNLNDNKRLRSSILLNDNGCHVHDSTEVYYFSVSLYFLSVIPQVITKILGDEATKLFYKAAAWPMLSAGLAGIVSPERWLFESGPDSELYPTSYEYPYYNSLLEIVLPFHIKEVSDFLSGNQKSADICAYSSLCEMSKNDIDKIVDELKMATKKSEDNFMNGKIPMHFK